MAQYKLTDEVASIVFGLVNASITDIPVYKGKKPTEDNPDVFIAINSLPIDANVMQKCRVNVNVHAKDLEDGTEDSTTMKTRSQQILALLNKVTATTYMIDFDGNESFEETALGFHFSNLKFSFKFINK